MHIVFRFESGDAETFERYVLEQYEEYFDTMNNAAVERQYEPEPWEEFDTLMNLGYIMPDYQPPEEAPYHMVLAEKAMKAAQKVYEGKLEISKGKRKLVDAAFRASNERQHIVCDILGLEWKEIFAAYYY